MHEISRTATYDAETRLSGHFLVPARLVASVLAMSSLIILVLTLPTYFTMLQKTCVGKFICSPTQLTPQEAQFLLHIGISPKTYAEISMAMAVVIILVYFGVALVIVRWKSNDWMGLLVALMLVFLGTGAILGYLSANIDEALWLYESQNAVNYSGFLLLIFVFCLFPGGTFVPRWTMWLIPCWSVVGFFSQFQLVSALWFIFLDGTISFILLGLGVIAQIYRYRFVSTVRERQQTKWILYGIALVFLFEAGLYITYFVLPQNLWFMFVIENLVLIFVQLLIPLSFGMAILRSHLWEIDIIINRTMVYGLLTATLTIIYIGIIVVLQVLFRAITGQTSDIANIGSTVAVVILFQPLRHRIQKGIDRHFYRRKYDVIRTLEDFNDMLHNEVDLSQLAAHLVSVIDEAMQPTQTLLWLRKPDTMNEEEA